MECKRAYQSIPAHTTAMKAALIIPRTVMDLSLDSCMSRRTYLFPDYMIDRATGTDGQ